MDAKNQIAFADRLLREQEHEKLRAAIPEFSPEVASFYLAKLSWEFRETDDCLVHLQGVSRSGELGARATELEAKCEIRSGKLARARSLLRQATDKHEALGNDEGAIRCLVLVGAVERQEADYGAAIGVGKRARELAVQLGKKSLATDAGLTLAGCFLDLGYFDRAKQEYEPVLAGSTSDRQKTVAKLGLGATYSRTGSLERAHPLLTQAYRAKTDPRTKGIACEFLGELRLREGALDKARRWFQRAVQIGTSISDLELQYEAQRQLAESERQLGSPDKAISLATESWNVFEEQGDVIEVALAQRVVGRALIEKGQFEYGVSLLSDAHEALVDVGDIAERTQSWRS